MGHSSPCASVSDLCRNNRKDTNTEHLRTVPSNKRTDPYDPPLMPALPPFLHIAPEAAIANSIRFKVGLAFTSSASNLTQTCKVRALEQASAAA